LALVVMAFTSVQIETDTEIGTEVTDIEGRTIGIEIAKRSWNVEPIVEARILRFGEEYAINSVLTKLKALTVAPATMPEPLLERR
jgi:hypothetical protein